MLSRLRRLYFSPTHSLSLSLSRYVSLSLSIINAIFKCQVIVLGESQLLGFENLEILRCCVLLLLQNFNLSLYSFCSGHNTNCDSGIFLGFALFGCCVLLLVFAALFVLLFFIRDHNTNCIFVGNCIVCLYYVSLLFIKDHYIDLDKPWNLCVGNCIVCLYCVLLFKQQLGPCVPFVCIVSFFIFLLA